MNVNIVLLYFLLFWFMDCKCVSNQPSVGGKLLSGREIIEWEGRQGEVMSLEVAFKGGS